MRKITCQFSDVFNQKIRFWKSFLLKRPQFAFLQKDLMNFEKFFDHLLEFMLSLLVLLLRISLFFCFAKKSPQPKLFRRIFNQPNDLALCVNSRETKFKHSPPHFPSWLYVYHSVC